MNAVNVGLIVFTLLYCVDRKIRRILGLYLLLLTTHALAKCAVTPSSSRIRSITGDSVASTLALKSNFERPVFVSVGFEDEHGSAEVLLLPEEVGPADVPVGPNPGEVPVQKCSTSRSLPFCSSALLLPLVGTQSNLLQK
ncbi:unnamed protein product [Strongylus vulgaris]|uniref:Uncharacterized protein n=1 Tax=Strongylus vulgaris TaxID=40348 RepID=A0A3P7LH81_STRVU|nr:unnamed protein product [Strongylus vulgaris]